MRVVGCGCEICKHKPCAGRVPIFTNLSDAELGKIISLIVSKHYKKGDMILMEGELSKSLIIVNNGMIKTFRYTPEGKEQILYIFSDGDFFGEMNLLGREEAPYNAEAVRDTSICVINKEDFQKLLLKYPEISLKVMEELCRRLKKMENMVQSMGTKDAEIRVIMVLLEFSERYGEDSPKGRVIELPLSREGIANYVGVARETVSRKLNYLKEEGIIEIVGNKKIILLDEKALEDLVS